MRGSLLSLTRALWRIVGARQGSSQHGRPPAVTAGGLVPSQTYKDLAACADNTAVNYKMLLLLLLLFLTFSALVANPKKTTSHGDQSRSWFANRGKQNKTKSMTAPPPPPSLPARCSFGEKKKKTPHASTCLGATQVGVTQVVSVRLASVQGFLRLVS